MIEPPIGSSEAKTDNVIEVESVVTVKVVEWISVAPSSSVTVNVTV